MTPLWSSVVCLGVLQVSSANCFPGFIFEVSELQKALKLKEQRKRTKSWKKKAWPSIAEDVDLLLGTIDVKVLSRVVRMVKMSKEQLFWCEEKMKRIDWCDGQLERDPSPILFPC